MREGRARRNPKELEAGGLEPQRRALFLLNQQAYCRHFYWLFSYLLHVAYPPPSPVPLQGFPRDGGFCLKHNLHFFIRLFIYFRLPRLWFIPSPGFLFLRPSMAPHRQDDRRVEGQPTMEMPLRPEAIHGPTSAR